MSFILDALKKSEAERQRQAGPALLEMRIVRPQRRLPLWVAAVCVALVACIVLLGWLAWRAGGPAPAGAAVSAPVQAPPPAQSTVATAASAAASAPASPAAAAYPPAAPASGPTDPPLQRTQPGSAPASGPMAGDADTDDADAARNPADQEPAVTPPPARVSGGSANLHSYAELSGRLPELRLDLHVYAAAPADRYAFINMRKVREGDVTPEGAQVREITRDGVVLDYQGTEFLLGRQ